MINIFCSGDRRLAAAVDRTGPPDDVGGGRGRGAEGGGGAGGEPGQSAPARPGPPHDHHQQARQAGRHQSNAGPSTAGKQVRME